MSNDPFASDPWADKDPWAEQAEDPYHNSAPAQTFTEQKENPRLTDSASNGNGKIVITLKAGADFAAPWIVIHADNASDADATLTGIFNGGLHEKVTRAGAMLAATRPAAAGNSAPPARQAAAPAPASLPPGVAAEYCEHGERIFKSGVSKSSGKPYKMLACPQNTCAPAWLK